MCYDVQSGTLAELKYAIQRGDAHEIEDLTRKLQELDAIKFPVYHVSGFARPKLIVFTNKDPKVPQTFTWGLIPSWTKSLTDAKKILMQTLNARGETIFEKPSFRNSAKFKRCLVYLDAFYEHHHQNKITYPFRISMKDGSPMVVAGLFEEWSDPLTQETHNTVTIVTTEANALMARIHNGKAEGPRMPLILTRDTQEAWLVDYKNETDKAFIQSLIKPCDTDLLTAHTVGRLKGKQALGNVPEVQKEIYYEELELDLSGV